MGVQAAKSEADESSVPGRSLFALPPEPKGAKGNKRSKHELPIQLQFGAIAQRLVLAMLCSKGLHIGNKNPDQVAARKEVLIKVRALCVCVLCVCCLFVCVF